jgi:hypothetical protein
MSIDVKIRLAKNAASQFNSDNPIMVCLKESYTEVMIPCLVEIRDGIKEWIDTPEISDEQDSSAVLFVLAGLIIGRGKIFEELKVRTNSPIEAARFDLCAGIHHDLSLEILKQAEWYEKNQNEKSLQTNQETQIKEETVEELIKPDVQQAQHSIVETFPTPVQNNQQDIAPSSLENSATSKSTLSVSEAGCLSILALGLIFIFAVGGVGAVIGVVSIGGFILVLIGEATKSNKS